jgi:hypothetical protein
LSGNENRFYMQYVGPMLVAIRAIERKCGGVSAELATVLYGITRSNCKNFICGNECVYFVRLRIDVGTKTNYL